MESSSLIGKENIAEASTSTDENISDYIQADSSNESNIEQVESLPEDAKINIILTSGLPHIWTGEDAYQLKRKCRIVGNPVGPIPRKPKNPLRLGLPWLLSPEETTLLLEKGFARLIRYPGFKKPPTQEEIEERNKLAEELYEEQCEYVKQQSLVTLENRLDQIVDGKRRKLEKKVKDDPSLESELKSLTREKVFAEEHKKMRKLPRNKQVVQTYLLPPNIHKMEYVEVEWTYPRSKAEKLRYNVFKDLWNKKYFITSGDNFGMDYLVYPGDPLLYHAAFGVRVVDDSQEINFLPMLACARLCTNVRKTFMLASCDESDQVHYLSWRWPGK